MTVTTTPTTTAGPAGAPAASPARRALGGLLAGLAGGLAMYTTLAGFALAQGRGAAYPLWAVSALMSGKRVLPDHPVPALHGAAAHDLATAPVVFLLPAVLVGLFTAARAARRSGATAGAARRAAVRPATAATAVLFVVLVLGVGFQEAPQHIQRFSSGYGVRQLGLLAWSLAHLAYVAVVVTTLRPLTTWATPAR